MEYVVNSFYRQHHKENDKEVRLIESVQNIFYTDAADKRHIRVKVINLRRSNNMELNKEQHGDHFLFRTVPSLCIIGSSNNKSKK